MTQRKRGTAHGLARIALAGGFAASLAGCGLSSVTSGIGGGVLGGSGSGSGQVKSVTEEQLLTAAKSDEPATGSTSVGEIAHGCPRFAIWPRDHHLTVYEPGRVGDGLAVAHRGEITKTARECQIQ
jgi:hypothetical protein